MRSIAKLLAVCIVLPAAALAQDQLKSRQGSEVGITVSKYRYTESDAAINNGVIKQTANKLGVEYSYTYLLGNDWSLRGDARYADGKADYSFNGVTLNGIKDWYYDVRGLVGKDLVISDHVVTPFAGIGYRYLVNDSSGRTANTGAVGYYRRNELWYLPLGITDRMAIGQGARLVSTAELDWVLEGKQRSNLSNVLAAAPNITNKQTSGYGFRFSVMYETGPWSFGPWVDYWRIKRSDTTTASVTILGTTFTGQFFEPGNNTSEFGLRAAYRF